MCRNPHSSPYLSYSLFSFLFRRLFETSILQRPSIMTSLHEPIISCNFQAWLGPNSNCTDPRKRNCWRWTNQCQSCLHRDFNVSPCFAMFCLWFFHVLSRFERSDFFLKNDLYANVCNCLHALECLTFCLTCFQPANLPLLEVVVPVPERKLPAPGLPTWASPGHPTKRCPPKCSSGEWKLRVPWWRIDIFCCMQSANFIIESIPISMQSEFYSYN